MDAAGLLIVIAPTAGALPIRVPVVKAITSVGSAPEADIRLAHLAPAWAVIRRESGALAVRLLGRAETRLVPGAELVADGVTLRCEVAESEAGLEHALDRLAGELAGAEAPEPALRLVLETAIEASGASHGAVIVSEDGAYRVAVAVDADGANLADAPSLLSDTIVRDVLGTGQRVSFDDARAHARYAAVPSVVSMALRSVVCLPMRIDGVTVGALFLGKRGAAARFGARLVADLKVLAAMSVPLVAQLRARPRVSAGDDLLGESEPMRAVRQLVARVGPSDLSALVIGESGTGKELVARALHAASPRAARALVALNCASVPETLLGAELFGYKRGAFTGANTDRAGLIEAADGSTLFLDEVGDMPLAMQAALLRVLEQREVKRLGENEPRAVDFRLVAATHRDLADEVAAGRFREDLRFRLQEVTLPLPPLRERGDDILLLAHVFLRQAEAQLGLRAHTLAPGAEAVLRGHAWPGNVRELRATMRRAAVLADASAIGAADLQLGGRAADDAAPDVGDLERPLAEARDAFVDRYVRAVLERHGGNREAAARALGIGVRTLYRYIA